MATLDQLIEHIRFGLGQLSIRNAHHAFEDLCRHYARERICSNILPATGPVSSGGDQGRDFETFRTYLCRSPLRDSAFIGLVSEGLAAFAVTTERLPLDSKVKSDIKTILRGHSKVQSIHFMCTADMPVSTRHKLQEWARTNHNTDLHIHDGRALAEDIAQKDLFWLATRYLEIPTELYPREFQPSDVAYEKALSRWRSATVDVNSFNEFCELKGYIRYATWEEKVKQDLPFWIAKMEEFSGSEPPNSLAKRARYEITVATLRGLGSLAGHEASVVPYFLAAVDTSTIQDIEDFTILLNYCTNATLIGHAQFSFQELKTAHERITRILDEQLKSRRDPSGIARLLLLRGYPAVHTITATGISIDFEQQLVWWLKIIAFLPKAHLFPVYSFAEMLPVLCGRLGSRPDLDKLTAAVDKEAAKRAGSFKTAELSVQRGLAHYDHGRLLAAISEIQKASINWFAEETLIQFCRSLLLLSAWYQKLGLCLAAKYHALAASFVAVRSGDQVREVAWKGLVQGAQCDYAIGAWASFLDLTEMAVHCHTMLAREPGNVDKHSELEAVLFHTCMSVALTGRLCPGHLPWITQRVKALGLGHDEEIALAKAQLAKQDTKALEESVGEQLWGMPISDLGITRTVSWAALGIEWSVSWQNVYHTTVLGEQLVATLQILQAEIARRDLCLPVARISLQFKTGPVGTPKVVPELGSDNFDFQWTVRWPRVGNWLDVDEAIKATLSLCFSILERASLLSQGELRRIFEDLFRNGMPARALLGSTYALVYSDIVSEDSFNKGRHTLALPEGRATTRRLRCHTELLASSGPGHGYSRELSLKHINARYENMTHHISFTLRRLQQSADFQQLVKLFRAKNWKDWHILSAVFNAVLNYRYHLQCKDHRDLEEMEDYMRWFMENKETGESPEVPLDELTEEKLDLQRKGSLGAVMKTWGLEIRHPALPISVIEDLLARRYAYWSDDVDHPDIFCV